MTGPAPSERPSVLICFAVPAEAGPFVHRRPKLNHCRTLITGIGAQRAGRAVASLLASTSPPPSAILTTGFAGGLNPDLSTGTLVYDETDPEFPWTQRLEDSAARMVRFFHAPRVLVTAEAKREARELSRADAVEMESAAIREAGRAARIPTATLRVILDTAHENLPLDFNRFLNDRQNLRIFRLITALLQSPRTLPPLIRFHRQTQMAASILADFLHHLFH